MSEPVGGVRGVINQGTTTERVRAHTHTPMKLKVHRQVISIAHEGAYRAQVQDAQRWLRSKEHKHAAPISQRICILCTSPDNGHLPCAHPPREESSSNKTCQTMPLPTQDKGKVHSCRETETVVQRRRTWRGNVKDLSNKHSLPIAS